MRFKVCKHLFFCFGYVDGYADDVTWNGILLNKKNQEIV